MKKRVVLSLFVLLAVACTLAATVFAEDAALPATCPHCQQAVTWTGLSTVADEANTLGEGHYYYDYAEASHGFTAVKEVSAKTCLYLPADKTLTGPDRVFTVTSTGELSVMGEGTLAGIGYTDHLNGGTVYVDGGKLNLLGGTLTTQLAQDRWVYRGGIIYMNGGTFNMSGGAVVDGKTNSTLTGTSGANGGNILLAGKSVMNMTAGTISGGTVTGNKYGSGGNIYVDSSAKVEMSGGSITGGSALAGGSGCVNCRGVFTVSGDAHVDIFRPSPISSKAPADTFAVSGKFTGSVRLNLVDSYVGVDKAIGKAKNDADISGGQIVACDLNNKPLTYYVEVRAGELVLATTTKEAYCEVCGTNQNWQRLDEAAAELDTLTEGHYYLSFASGSSVWTTKSVSGKVCLDLNGMEIQGKNRLFTLSKNAELSIQGNGTVTGGGFAADTANGSRSGGVAYVPSTATLNIYGGTYDTALYAETDLKSYNGGAFWCQGIMNVYDGAISGDASNAGDAVFLQTNGKLNVYGGSLAGDVYAKGAVYLANNPTVEEIVLKTNDLTIEGLYAGATQLNITDPVDGMVIGKSINAYLKYAEFWVVGYKTSLFVTAEGEDLKLSKFAPTYPYHVELKYCEACDKECHFVELTEAHCYGGRLTTGHYYLNFADGAEDCGAFEISGTDRVCLDLNGNTLNSTSRAFHVRSGSILNVMDSKGGGKITGKGTYENTPYGGVIFVRVGAQLNLYGGTLEYIAPDDGRNAVARGGVIYALGDVNLYGGTITGGKAGAGGNIYIDATSDGVGHLRAYGGTVEKGTATSAGVCVINRGYTTLSGDPTIYQIRRTTSNYSPAAGDCLTIENSFKGSVELYYPYNYNGMDIGNLVNADISEADIRFGSLENSAVQACNDNLLAVVGEPAAVLYKEDESTAAYEDLSAAIAAFDNTCVKIVLFKDAENVAVATDAWIDLNGFHITGSVTGSGTLFVMDSKTADFTVTDGVYGTVTKADNVKPVEQGSICSEDGYLMIEESGKLSFHRVSLSINSMALRSEKAGVYFNSDFAGDEMVQAKVSTFGVKVSVEGDPAETEGTVRQTSFGAAAFNTGAEATSSLIYGIMKPGNTEDVNKANAAMQIYGRAYVRFTDGTELLGACRSRSLMEQCAEVNPAWNDLTINQKRAFMDMFYQYEPVMRGADWSVSNAVSIANRKTSFAEIDYTPYLAPWTEDVVAKAKADGKIHYYFMAGEGLHISDGQTYKDKWGDACLIVFPDGQTMLVDSGPLSYAPVLATNLERMGITHLDYLMFTHPHSDHQNGIFHDAAILNIGLIDRITIDKVLWRGGYDERADTTLPARVTRDYGIPCEVVERGDVFRIGDVRLEIIWPNAGDGDSLLSGGEEINSMSITMRFDYGEHSALFTGDLYVSGEMNILERVDTELLKADFLKVPHHAYNTSSCSAFLNAVDPDLAVATGRLPVPQVVYNRYEDLGIEMLDDRIYGYIHVTADAEGVMTTETSRTEFNGDTNTPEAGEDEVPEEDGGDA